MSELVEHIGRTYDELPYESAAFAATAPEHLAAVAHLFALRAPDPAGARVLELGCAAGGNVIPFAARHPDARALGVDLAAAHVDAGTQAIAALDLTNIELRRMSIADIGPDLGKFDYIVCHGVYSWVPPDVRDAILRVCSENLADDGVAIVSYNTYPGWKAKEIVRDAMMLRGAGRPTPGEQLAYARGMIDFLHDMAASGSVLKKVLDDNVDLIRNGEDYYLVHEFLELCNAPCYFRDFLACARAHDLDYLAESDVESMFASNYGHAAGPLLKECAGSQTALEQLLDFLSNRTFRQTLLVHAGRHGDIRYRLEPSRIRPLHIAGRFTAAVDGGHGSHRFNSPRGHTVSVDRPEQAALLQALNGAFPATMSTRDYIAPLSDDAQRAVLSLIEQLIITGDLGFRLQPVRADAVPERPRALTGLGALATLRAEANVPLSLFNAWHEDVGALELIERRLLPLLDEMHDHAALIDAVLDQIRTGQLHFRENDQQVTDPERIEQLVNEHVQRALEALRMRAMLAPATTSSLVASS